MLRKALGTTMVASLAFISVAALGAEKVENPGELCRKATTISSGLAKACADEFGMSTYDIRLHQALPTTSGEGCDTTIDTPRGTRRLYGGTDLYHNSETDTYFVTDRGRVRHHCM